MYCKTANYSMQDITCKVTILVTRLRFLRTLFIIIQIRQKWAKRGLKEAKNRSITGQNRLKSLKMVNTGFVEPPIHIFTEPQNHRSTFLLTYSG